MPVKRRTTRKAPVRRRRRSMGQKITASKVNAATMTAVKAGLGCYCQRNYKHSW